MTNHNGNHENGNRPAQQGDTEAPLSVRDAVRHLLPETHAEPAPGRSRTITIDDEPWIARIAGHSAVGTGARGHAFLTAIHFCRAGEPDLPVREALLPRGRFDGMFDEELRELFREARPILAPEERGGEER